LCVPFLSQVIPALKDCQGIGSDPFLVFLLYPELERFGDSLA
jgi:hypothetical protein